MASLPNLPLPRTTPSPPPRLHVLSWSGTDAALLELAHADAPQAAARIYDRFCKDVNRVIFRLLGPDADHDDLVQETFLRVLRKIRQVREPEKLASWVVSVAVNTVYGELKRRKLRRWLLRETQAQALPDHPGSDHESRELVRALFRVLDAMPLSERQVFSLRHLDDRTMPEIAELCGCSLRTAKRSLVKAEQRFETLASRMSPELSGKIRPTHGDEP